MDRSTFSTWVETLGRAWTTQNPRLAADLFTEDATYQENPFDPPLHGRPAILKYWIENTQAQKDIQFDYEILEVTPTSGVARWSVSFCRIRSGINARLEGVFVAAFREGAQQAHAFREWWHIRESQPDRRVALITGASRGLGAALAGFLAAQGYALILTARGAEALAATARALDRFGTPVIALAGDVTDPAHRQRLVEAARQLGCLDVLINNASELGPGPLPMLADYPLEVLQRVFAVNVVAPVGLVQAALPLLKESRGLIVNVSSDAAIGAYEHWGGYGASKAALDLISRTLANELQGVGVVSVDPGEMRTVMHQQAFPGEDISDRPDPDVTLPFWAWLLGQDPLEISGSRFQAQAEQWRVAV